jgi:hypothetical protein
MADKDRYDKYIEESDRAEKEYFGDEKPRRIKTFGDPVVEVDFD